MAWMAGWSCWLVVLALSAGADTDGAADLPDGEAAVVAPSDSAAPESPAVSPSVAEPPPGVSLPDFLLEQGLLHSATSLLYASDSTPARGARIVALTHAATKLNPKDPALNALLALLYETQGDFARAADAVRAQLEHDATSAELGVAWLNLGQKARQTLADRITFLQDASEDEALPPYTRAQAFSSMGDLHLQHGDRALAAKAYGDALALDDRLFSALFGQFAMVDRKDASAHVGALLNLLGANPMYSGGALELATVLRARGIADQAVFFYGYTWRLAARDMETVDAALAPQYFDAMLDAGQYRQAIETMVPVMNRMKAPSWEMLCQLMEAYAGLNDLQKVSDVRGRLLQEMTDALESRPTPEVYRQLAWYFLMSDAIIQDDRRQSSVRDCALKAKEGLKGVDANDPVLQLVLAVVQAKEAGKRFLSGGISAAEFTKQLGDLTALAEKDPYAAYFLAEQLFLAADRLVTLQPAATVSQGLSLVPFGRAMRLLRQTADRHNVPVPGETEPTKTVREQVAKWLGSNGPLLDVALVPERHIRVTLAPAAPVRDRPFRAFKPMTPVFDALAPIEIEVRLQNTSTVDIPLGSAGLCHPVVAPRANAESRGVKAEFDRLPSAVLPAPRVLKAGAEVVTRVRVDVGALEEYLARRPLDLSTFIVNGTLDPVQRGRQIVSSLPTVVVARASFGRVDILGDFDEKGDWAARYQRTLQYTVNDFQNGTLEQRLSAARAIGSLLTVTGDMATRRMNPPRQLVTVVEAPTLLSMFRAILKAPDVATRQEALRALGYASVDGRLLGQMGPAFEDPDPLVRLRAVEVIGHNRPPEFRRILERFLDDKDPMVRMVARAMLEQRTQPSSPAAR